MSTQPKHCYSSLLACRFACGIINSLSLFVFTVHITVDMIVSVLKGSKNIIFVLISEARAHGVSYFEFSTNEEERLRQQEALKHLRNETIEKQQASETLHARRQHQLKV